MKNGLRKSLSNNNFTPFLRTAYSKMIFIKNEIRNVIKKIEDVKPNISCSIKQK